MRDNIRAVMSFVSFLGGLGTVIYLASHAYLSVKTNCNRRVYYGGNFVAALMILMSSAVIGSWQAVAVNGFWAAVSALLFFGVGLLRINGLVFRFVLFLVSAGVVAAWIRSGDLGFGGLSWLSVLVFSLAYLFFCAGKITPGVYFLWSAYAALTMLPQLWLDQNLSVFALEIVWAGVSFFGAQRWYSGCQVAS